MVIVGLAPAGGSCSDRRGSREEGRQQKGGLPHTCIAASLQQHALYLDNLPECGMCLRNSQRQLVLQV